MRNFNRFCCTDFCFVVFVFVFLSFFLFILWFSFHHHLVLHLHLICVCVFCLRLAFLVGYMNYIRDLCVFHVRILNANKCSFFSTMWHAKLVSMLSHTRQHQPHDYCEFFSLDFIYLFFILYFHCVDMQVPDQIIINVYTYRHA